jgi:hypothetical protein
MHAQPDTFETPRFRVVAVAGEVPSTPEIWAVKKLHQWSVEIAVVQVRKAKADRPPVRPKLSERLLAMEHRLQNHELDRLLDGPALREWWKSAPLKRLQPVPEPHSEVRAMQAHAVLSLPCEEAEGPNLGLPELPLLRLRIRRAPPLANVCGEAELRRNGEHHLWRFAPQRAPGETAAVLALKALAESLAGLHGILQGLQGKAPPQGLSDQEWGAAAVNEGVWGLMRYFAQGRGRRARELYQAAICP